MKVTSALGVLLLIIGTVASVVGFRGFRPLDVVAAAALSLLALWWVVHRLNGIIARAQPVGEPSPAPDVAWLVGQTRRTGDVVLESAADVTRISEAVADVAEQVTASLARLTAGAYESTLTARRIGGAAQRLTVAAGAVVATAREALAAADAVARLASLRAPEQQIVREALLRTVTLAQGVVTASAEAEALVGDLGTATTQVARVAEGTAAETAHVAGATARQRELTDNLRHTGAALERSGAALREAIARFGDVTGDGRSAPIEWELVDASS